MYPRSCKRLAAIFAVFCAATLPADEVKLRKKPVFRGVAILDFRDGDLIFRGVSRQTLRKPIAQVEWFTIDRYPALTNAEQLAAANEWPSAVRSYQLAMDNLVEPWLRDWIQLRILRALDGTGAYDQAVSRYIELLSARDESVSLPPPRNPGPPGSRVNANARLILTTALDEPLKNRVRGQLESLLLELVMLDPEMDIPRQLKVPDDLLPDRDREASADGTKSKKKKKKKRRRYGLLPEYATAAPVTKLPAGTPLLPRIQRDLDAGETDRAAEELQEVRPFLHTDDEPRADFLQARIHIAERDYASAFELLSQLAELPRTSEFRCDALYYAGLTATRLERFDVAIDYLDTLADDGSCDEIWTDLAQQVRDEVKKMAAKAD